jgi:hypothetical protein
LALPASLPNIGKRGSIVVPQEDLGRQRSDAKYDRDKASIFLS